MIDPSSSWLCEESRDDLPWLVRWVDWVEVKGSARVVYAPRPVGESECHDDMAITRVRMSCVGRVISW
jgi:hypothetical protein